MRRVSLGSKGQVLVLVALMMMVLIAIAAFALDVGLAYGVRAKLNAAVDAAAIAALRERTSGTGTDSSAQLAATNYLNANFPSDSIGIARPTCDVRLSLQNGAYVVSVTATAVVPTYFAKVVGLNGFTVTATSEATRSGVDVALVLDTTASLNTVFSTVQAQATAFANKFSDTNDRLALVPFATGVGVADTSGELVLTNGVEISKSTRGFNKSAIRSAIYSLVPDGYTATEFGMRMGIYQLDKVASPNPLRAIVLFSDGAPNAFTGSFPIDAAGSTKSGNLFSGTTFPGPPKSLYHADVTSDRSPESIGLYKIPEKGGGNYIGTVRVLPELPVTNPKRSISFYDFNYPQEQKCEANKAARNMLENVANYARSRGIVVYALGYGDKLDQPDITMDCSTYNETGSTIMMRIANTTESDTYNPAQPSGIFCRARTTEQLSRCFDTIANALLRLTK